MITRRKSFVSRVLTWDILEHENDQFILDSNFTFPGTITLPLFFECTRKKKKKTGVCSQMGVFYGTLTLGNNFTGFKKNNKKRGTGVSRFTFVRQLSLLINNFEIVRRK